MRLNSPRMTVIYNACMKASKSLIRDFGEIEKLQVSTKGPGDFVTAADKRTEKIIIEELLKAHPKAQIILGQDAQKIACSPMRNLSILFFKPFSIRQADRLVTDSQQIELAGLSLGVLDLPGHSPGSIGLYDAQAQSVYCGDTLFAGSVGRTDFPGASGELLLESIRSKLLTLPDATTVWPGHGPSTTIGVERRTNPFLNGRG